MTSRETVQHDCPVALILIDVINDFQFEQGARLARYALPMARNLVRLKRAAKRRGIPCLYVNDNFDQWRSDFRYLVARCIRHGECGASIARLLAPDRDDYFVLKPMHSGFYRTPLDVLLQKLGARKLILCGLTTDSCVLFTANDAYLRDFGILVPEDCSTALSKRRHAQALGQMRNTLHADTNASRKIDFAQLLRAD
jgi:nicotinamidase-related amidase